VPKHSAVEAETDIEMLEDVNNQGLFMFKQNVFAQKVEEYILRYVKR
jgi:hypothetical protein